MHVFEIGADSAERSKGETYLARGCYPSRDRGALGALNEYCLYREYTKPGRTSTDTSGCCCQSEKRGCVAIT
jgi:hypothetical protein